MLTLAWADRTKVSGRVVHETGIVLAFLLACIWRLSEAEPFIEPPRPARTKQKAKPTDLLLDLS